MTCNGENRNGVHVSHKIGGKGTFKNFVSVVEELVNVNKKNRKETTKNGHTTSYVVLRMWSSAGREKNPPLKLRLQCTVYTRYALTDYQLEEASNRAVTRSSGTLRKGGRDTGLNRSARGRSMIKLHPSPRERRKTKGSTAETRLLELGAIRGEHTARARLRTGSNSVLIDQVFSQTTWN